jgi:hypothetical protein
MIIVPKTLSVYLGRLLVALLRRFLQDLGEHVIRIDAFGLGFEVEDDAVAHGGEEDAADVERQEML